MIPTLACSYSTVSSKELLEKVIPDYCIDNPRQCIFWERGSNDTYQIKCDKAVYFLRLYRSGAFPREATEFEAEVLHYLHQQGFPVAYPIARKSGGFISEVAAYEGTRYVLVTAVAEGQSVDYESLDNCRLVGESLAQFHLASNWFKTARTRTPLNTEGLLDNSMPLIREHFVESPDALRDFEEIAQSAREAVLAVPEDDLNTGICHGDFHGGNLHCHEGKITHFDFEECAFGYRVYDLATFKWDVGVGDDDAPAKRWSAFLEGYESCRRLSESERSLVNTFVIFREIAETAFGIKHVKDFGLNEIMASDVKRVHRRLSYLKGLV